MPPRAEDIAIEEAVAPSDAAADGAQFFASVKQEGQDQQPAEEVPSDDSKSKKVKKNKSLFSSFLSEVERDLSKIGKSLEDGFIDAIDRTPLGVNTDKSRQEEEGKEATARTSSAVSSKKKKKKALPSPWCSEEPEEEGSDKSTLDRKGSSVAKVAKKSAVAVGGGALIGVGVVMIPTLPPPFASIAMLGGYALLGTEFKGPRKVVKNARDKMRKIGNDKDGNEGHEAKEGESPSEIEKEFTNGENEKMLDSSIKKGKKKNPVKSVQKKVQKLSKKYVLPVLERACEVYEKFEDKDQVAKEEGFEIVKEEEGEEATVAKESEEKNDEIKEDNSGTNAQSEQQEEDASVQEEAEAENEEFVDAKEDWIDVDEDATATDESDEEAVLV